MRTPINGHAVATRTDIWDEIMKIDQLEGGMAAFVTPLYYVNANQIDGMTEFDFQRDELSHFVEEEHRLDRMTNVYRSYKNFKYDDWEGRGAAAATVNTDRKYLVDKKGAPVSPTTPLPLAAYYNGTVIHNQAEPYAERKK